MVKIMEVSHQKKRNFVIFSCIIYWYLKQIVLNNAVDLNTGNYQICYSLWQIEVFFFHQLWKQPALFRAFGQPHS
jgi:hypothetical protein